MSRLDIVLVVIVALLWPPASLAHTAFEAQDEVAHSVLHWQGESHHHHEDGSFHVDASSESVAHLAADQLTSAPALPVSDCVVSGFAVSKAPLSAVDSPPADPFVAGLLRPPRQIS